MTPTTAGSAPKAAIIAQMNVTGWPARRRNTLQSRGVSATTFRGGPPMRCALVDCQASSAVRA